MLLALLESEEGEHGIVKNKLKFWEQPTVVLTFQLRVIQLATWLQLGMKKLLYYGSSAASKDMDKFCN